MERTTRRTPGEARTSGAAGADLVGLGAAVGARSDGADGFDRYVVEFQRPPEPDSVMELEVACAGKLRTSPGENAINRIDASWVELDADAG